VKRDTVPFRCRITEMKISAKAFTLFMVLCIAGAAVATVAKTNDIPSCETFRSRLSSAASELNVKLPALKFLPKPIVTTNEYQLWTVAIEGRGDFESGRLVCRERTFVEIFLPWENVEGTERALTNLAAIEIYAFAVLPPAEVWKIAGEAVEKRRTGTSYATPVKLPTKGEVAVGSGVLLTLIDTEKCPIGPPFC
jgi:hypothetical protein